MKRHAIWSPWQAIMEIFGWSVTVEMSDDGWKATATRDELRVDGSGANGCQAAWQLARQACSVAAVVLLCLPACADDSINAVLEGCWFKPTATVYPGEPALPRGWSRIPDEDLRPYPADATKYADVVLVVGDRFSRNYPPKWRWLRNDRGEYWYQYIGSGKPDRDSEEYYQYVKAGRPESKFLQETEERKRHNAAVNGWIHFSDVERRALLKLVRGQAIYDLRDKTLDTRLDSQISEKLEAVEKLRPAEPAKRQASLIRERPAQSQQAIVPPIIFPKPQ